MTDEIKAVDKAPKRRRAAWWVEILIAAAVVLAIVGIAIPAYNSKKTEARRTEAKQGLHDIQIAVERFAVDTGGTYPEYLIGGSAPRGEDSKHPFAQASDPLLRKGYLTAYPRNPFAVQQNVKAMQEQYKDPFRPGTSESKYGYRFGEDYTLMGQVLADFRYPKFPNQKMEKINGLTCYRDTEYPFWDIWPRGEKPKAFLPGEFFYKPMGYLKQMGNIKVPDLKNVKLEVSAAPENVEYYMLGLYGGSRDRGIDILGPEPNTVVGYISSVGVVLCPAWTRSTTDPDISGKYLGSPFGPAVEGAVNYSSPNGINDAVILVIVPGLEGVFGRREKEEVLWDIKELSEWLTAIYTVKGIDPNKIRIKDNG
jgi:hypothetical protein